MFTHFYNNVLKFDFINKFNYSSLFNIPQFCQINLIFQSKSFSYLLNNLILLNVFLNKNNNFYLSLKKNLIIKSKVIFKYNLLNKIITKLIVEILPFFIIQNFFYFYIDKLLLFTKLKNLNDNIIATLSKSKIITIFGKNNKYELNYINKNIKLRK